MSLCDLHGVVCLERVLEDILDLYLGLFELNLVLEAAHLLHGLYVLGVDLSLEQVEVVDLVRLVAALLGGSHLRLGEVDALGALFGLLLLIFEVFLVLLLQGLLLVEDFGLLLTLAAVLQVLESHFTQILSAEHVYSIRACNTSGRNRLLIVKLKLGTGVLRSSGFRFSGGAHELGEEFIVLSLAGLSAWGLNCLDVESSQEVIERGVLKHLINIDLLEGHSRLKLHEHVVCQGI